jgi:alpha-beta hydrolase superfamily lysophospholipase
VHLLLVPCRRGRRGPPVTEVQYGRDVNSVLHVLRPLRAGARYVTCPTVGHERTFVDAYGVEIFSRWWMVDAPRGVVLIAHGASEHSARYARFASALNAAGFSAIAIDHRGHGHTAPGTGRGIMGAGGGRAVLDDLHELRAAASAATGDDVPIFLFGHSMGSLIALGYLALYADGLAGSILCGVAANVDDAASVGALLGGFAEAGMRDQPVENLLGDNNKPFEPARTGYDWLSRDPDEVDRYIADPMCGDDNPLTYGYLIDLFEVVAPARDRLGTIDHPVLVIAGDHDPAAAMGEHATTLTAALHAAGVPADLTLYPGARHELLNETNRDEVTADIVDWLQSHLR